MTIARGSIPVSLSGLSYPTADGASGQYLQTNGSATLSFATPPVLFATFSISSAAIKLLNTPLLISSIAAPGANNYIQVHQCSMSYTAGTAYGNGGNIYLIYGATRVVGSGTPSAAGLVLPVQALQGTTSVVGSTAGQIGSDPNGTFYYPTLANMPTLSNIRNAQLYVTIVNGSTNFSTGTGTIAVRVWYSIVAA